MHPISPDKVHVPFRETTKRDVHWGRLRVGGDVIIEPDSKQWSSIRSSVSRFNFKKKVKITCTVGKGPEGVKVMFVRRVR